MITDSTCKCIKYILNIQSQLCCGDLTKSYIIYIVYVSDIFNNVH